MGIVELTSIIGVFTFSGYWIARLHLEQQADEKGGELLDEPETDTVGGVLVLRQKALIDE